MSFHLLKFVKGWRLDKLFSHPTTVDIPVKNASLQAILFLKKVEGFINSPDSSLLASLFGDNYNSLVVSAQVIIPEIIANLYSITTLPDIADSLQQFKFSDDPKKDKIYHDIVTSAAHIFSDGRLSINDAAAALILLEDF